jgi:hypothetical protein
VFDSMCFGKQQKQLTHWPLVASRLVAGLDSSGIRHAYMGIGLLVEVPALVRTHRHKMNYAAEPDRCRLGAHNSLDN